MLYFPADHTSITMDHRENLVKAVDSMDECDCRVPVTGCSWQSVSVHILKELCLGGDWLLYCVFLHVQLYNVDLRHGHSKRVFIYFWAGLGGVIVHLSSSRLTA